MRRTAKDIPLTQKHSRAPDASEEKIRQLAGIVRLTRPVPSVQGLDKLRDDGSSDRARD
jgi:hypothetical protein